MGRGPSGRDIGCTAAEQGKHFVFVTENDTADNGDEIAIVIALLDDLQGLPAG